MASQTKMAEALRAIGIYNEHGLLTRFADRDTAIGCSYAPREAREARASGTAIWSPHFLTDPAAPWYCRGQKFVVGRRSDSLPAALAWATERYGINEWAPSPFDPMSFKVPAYVMERARKAIKEASNGDD